MTSESDGSLSRIDPRARIVTEPINVGRRAGAVAVGPGAVWVANSVDGTVTRVDPATNAVSADDPRRRRAERDRRRTGRQDGLGQQRDSPAPCRRSTRPRQVVRKVTTGNRPEGVALSGNTMYVAVRASGLAHRGGTLTVAHGRHHTVDRFDSIDPAVAYTYADWSALTLTNDGLVDVQARRRQRRVRDSSLTSRRRSRLPPTAGGRTRSSCAAGSTTRTARSSGRRTSAARSSARSPPTRATGIGTGFYFSSIAGAGAVPEDAEALRPLEGDRDRPGLEHGHLPPRRRPTRTSSSSSRCPPPTPCRRARRSKARLPLPATGPYMIAGYDAKRGVSARPEPALPRVVSQRPSRTATRTRSSGGSTSGRARNGAPSSRERPISRTTPARPDHGRRFRPPTLLTGLQTRYASQLHLDPAIATYYVFLNTRLPPFNNLKARQAVNYAVDRDRMAALQGGPESRAADLSGAATEHQRLPALLPLHDRAELRRELHRPRPRESPAARRRIRHEGRRSNRRRGPPGASNRTAASTSSRCSAASATELVSRTSKATGSTSPWRETRGRRSRPASAAGPGLSHGGQLPPALAHVQLVHPTLERQREPCRVLQPSDRRRDRPRPLARGRRSRSSLETLEKGRPRHRPAGSVGVPAEPATGHSRLPPRRQLPVQPAVGRAPRPALGAIGDRVAHRHAPTRSSLSVWLALTAPTVWTPGSPSRRREASRGHNAYCSRDTTETTRARQELLRVLKYISVERER